ncbi:hypothetical protein ABPG75_008034 [Micractinium tetrahymenae]
MQQITVGAPSNSVAVRSPQARPEPAAAPSPAHPLDSLSPAELRQAAAAVKEYAAQLGVAPVRFNSVHIVEPVKYEVLAFLRGEGPCPPRHALAVVELPGRNAVCECVLDLDAAALPGSGGKPRVLSWKQMDGVQAAVTLDDVLESEEALKKNAEFRALVRERYGITDMDLLAVDPWYSGYRYGHPEGRIMQFLLYNRACPDDNPYAHPLDCIVFYDMHTDKLHGVHAFGGEGGRQVPPQLANYHRALVEAPFRTSMKPLDIVQPHGPSFSVEGNVVTWENWQLHVGFSWREGLVLNNLQGRLRPILHRAALAEIIVPYGDPREPFQHKCAYDIADYGLGLCAVSLELGCDCLGHIKYFDAVVNNSKGEAVTIKKAVCMHEEDAGTAWKQVDYRTGHLEVRRHRRLVISFWAVIANYSYGFYWHLYQDGTISFEARLTGIVSTNSMYPNEQTPQGGEPLWGTRLAPGLNAQIHQHFFMVRVDPAIDCKEGGKHLQVVEVDAQPMPLGPGNPHGVGFDITERVLRSEGEAQRDAAPERSRVWKIQNPAVLNPASGKPVAFKLMPGTPTPPMLAHPSSAHATRGAFATKHLWVTPYHPKEMNPAGDYPLHPNPEENPGIADWTRADRNLDGADCVLWFNLGLTHVVRTEDWPVMPVEHLTFHLKPWGFFRQNPLLDLPPDANAASRDCDEEGPRRGGSLRGPAAGALAAPAACCARPAAQPALPRSKL